MTYWVIRCEHAESYLGGFGRFGAFEKALHFRDKNAALLVADTLATGATIVLEVSDSVLDSAATPDLPEWVRERITRLLDQKQHHQGAHA